ncbi:MULTISPECIES: class I SAM-dependent methyltransferase [Lutispora]|uniref:Class I SAM-dependent methyltransferase n=1 Tax=Lutispora saccharofermentans TaxID=3024236 RepID=A0ABT1NFA3_9FIRM|nr:MULTISPECIES: class I SAM-dependent methyltransferase [Lutispora]MCQ1529947.1 class I SAM-dependent methyltransferase [Lutispora saccharofermentans]MEA4962206.1 class I SAM-dependent methyltransferase [Lutispora sp.]
MEGIAKYYEGYDEESRLIKDNSHKVEFISTTHVLDKKIKKDARILEVGAGTGRYSFYYLNKGHMITALDIVQKNVELMMEKARTIESKNIEIKLGDARNLSQFDSNTFDVVLCLGPIYHLSKLEDRIKCIGECMRVLKPGGILAVAYINRYAQYVIQISRDKNYINDESLRSITKSGIEPEEGENCFYFSTYDEMEETMAGFSAEKLEHVGTDGIVHMMRDNINALDESELEKWLDYHFMTFDNPSLIGYSLHNLYVCKKK